MRRHAWSSRTRKLRGLLLLARNVLIVLLNYCDLPYACSTYPTAICLGDTVPTEIDIRITPALHPDNVKEIEGYNDETALVLGPAVTAFSEAYEGIRSVLNAREKAKSNPTWNEAQQIIATDDLAQMQFARIAKGFDSVRVSLEKGIAHIEGELSAPVTSRAAASISAEIRAHVKGLKLGERQSFIQQAVADGDDTSATAILGAPAYLSGFDANMQKVLLRLYHERNSPQLARRLKVMQGAKALIEERAGLVFGQLEKAVGAPPHKARALRDAKSAAERAFVMSDGN